MKGAVFAALAATMGNMLQGWDNATIAGAVIYIKREFHLETQPTLEGLILATSLIGATVITTFSGPVSDSVGRRPMLIISALLYFLGALVMLWSPTVYVLLLGRLFNGFGVGLAVTLVPVYVSESSPPEIRGQLNTLPQFTGSGGMFFAYCMVFSMSLMDAPKWRLMLGVLSIPSLMYLALMLFYLPESPRWLVSKGKMKEAKRVLQRLRGKEDVNGEMALLVEGLGTGEDTSIEEYVIGPGTTDEEGATDKDQIKLFGAEQGQSWVAKPVKGQSMLGMASQHGSMANMIDPVVNLFGSVHENVPSKTGSMRSAIFPTFGSMYAGDDNNVKHENWENDSHGEETTSNFGHEDSDENLKSPLLSPPAPGTGPSSLGSITQGGEVVNSTGIGGGWQLAYKKVPDGKGEMKRVYLHQEPGMGSARGSMRGSIFSQQHSDASEGQLVQAAGLVSQSILNVKDFKADSALSEHNIKPTAAATKGSNWRELLEPGVKSALIVGVGIQILQQFSGINGVLYYTPQILAQAGVDVLLSDIGISGDSASLLISALTTLLMLPTIGLAMRLMDLSGRRFLLLNTLPILVASLVVLVLSNVINMGTVMHATLSTISVMVYFCTFVMGFGPIPNILCSEIFPTRVRGLCIAICALTFWFGNIIVTYSLPALLTSIGLAGVFAIYATVCTVSWFFVYLKVPETKGMPLEVISEFFNVGARQAEADKNL